MPMYSPNHGQLLTCHVMPVEMTRGSYNRGQGEANLT